jgi:hypothetical protein
MNRLSRPVSGTDARDSRDRLTTGCAIVGLVLTLITIALSVLCACTIRRAELANARDRRNAFEPDIPIRFELDIRIHVIEPPGGGPGDRPQAVEKEADPERKRRLLAVARELGGAAKSIVINVASEILEHRLPR